MIKRATHWIMSRKETTWRLLGNCLAMNIQAWYFPFDRWPSCQQERETGIDSAASIKTEICGPRPPFSTRWLSLPPGHLALQTHSHHPHATVHPELNLFAPGYGTLLMWSWHGRITGNALSTRGAFHARSLSRIDIAFMSTKIRKPSVAALSQVQSAQLQRRCFHLHNTVANLPTWEWEPTGVWFHRELLFLSGYAVSAARNKNGQDMVIKYATHTFLLSDTFRDDPRNHTIPVLKYFGDFVNLAELVRYTWAFLEVSLALLRQVNLSLNSQGRRLSPRAQDCTQRHHPAEHAHRVVVPSDLPNPCSAGLRGLERKYVFETATLASVDESPSSVELEKAYKHDVCLLAVALEPNLRVCVWSKIQTPILCTVCWRYDSWARPSTRFHEGS